MSPSGKTYVIVVRDPDYDNDFTIVGPSPVEAIDIDLGRGDLRDPAEFAGWLESHQGEIERLRDLGDDEAADAYQKIIDGLDRPDAD
jgi:hypothetical protein